MGRALGCPQLAHHRKELDPLVMPLVLLVCGGGPHSSTPQEDGGLLGFAAFKDLPISFEEDAQAEVRLNIQELWVVPKRATRHADMGDVYGVGLEAEDEDSEDEDLQQLGEVASSSSSDLVTHQLSPLPLLTLSHR